jgi:hypothetical protein
MRTSCGKGWSVRFWIRTLEFLESRLYGHFIVPGRQKNTSTKLRSGCETPLLMSLLVIMLSEWGSSSTLWAMELDYPLDYHHGSPFLTNQDSMEWGLTLEASTHGWRVVDDLHNFTDGDGPGMMGSPNGWTLQLFSGWWMLLEQELIIDKNCIYIYSIIYICTYLCVYRYVYIYICVSISL